MGSLSSKRSLINQGASSNSCDKKMTLSQNNSGETIGSISRFGQTTDFDR